MKNDYDIPEWHECPKGALTDVVVRLNRDVRSESFRRVSGVAFVVCFILVVGALQLGKPVNSELKVGNLSCDEVSQLLPQYKSNTLDDQLSKRVDAHLSHCPACRQTADDLIVKSQEFSRKLVLFAFGP